MSMMGLLAENLFNEFRFLSTMLALIIQYSLIILKFQSENYERLSGQYVHDKDFEVVIFAISKSDCE